MTTIRIDRDLTVQKVLEAWPSTRNVFIGRRMACVGCDLAPFMTIAEAEAAYGIPAGDLERELQAAAKNPQHPITNAAATRPHNAATGNPESGQ